MYAWIIGTLTGMVRATSPILHHYGVAAIVAVLLAENLGLIFAPGESVIVAGGFLAAKGILSIWVVIPAGIMASILGGYAAYALGTRYGHEKMLRYGRYLRITPSMLDRVHRFFQRFGAPVVTVGRFIVPLRQLQGYVAGAAAMGFPRFALWSAVGAVLWVSVWGLGSWALAQQIPVHLT